MFKRLFWLAIGIGFGFGLAFWFTRYLREAIARYSPERMSNDLASAIRSLGQDLRAAVVEGRDAMREREDEIRAELASTHR
ncbi:MAG TPA: hypothetical protein VHI95_12455 [Acidimicrobiales bacterium]|nr:hypothetical protein [Acidimicrobiales bacterium]